MSDNAFLDLRRKRAVLRRSVSRTLGTHADFPVHSRRSSDIEGSDVAGAHRPRLLPGLSAEERHQHRPAVESFQDPRRSGSGGESEGEGGGKA